jgi:hypothetical protein
VFLVAFTDPANVTCAVFRHHPAQLLATGLLTVHGPPPPDVIVGIVPEEQVRLVLLWQCQQRATCLECLMWSRTDELHQVPGRVQGTDPAALDPLHGPLFVYRTPVFRVDGGAAPSEVPVFVPYNASSITGGLFRFHCVAVAGPVCSGCGAVTSAPALAQVFERTCAWRELDGHVVAGGIFIVGHRTSLEWKGVYPKPSKR